MLNDYSEGVRYLIMVIYVFAVCLNSIFFSLIYNYLLENRIYSKALLYIVSIVLAIPSSCIVSYLLFYAIGFIIRYIQLSL